MALLTCHDDPDCFNFSQQKTYLTILDATGKDTVCEVLAIANDWF